MYWLDVSPDDILAAEVRRSEWEDEEDDGNLDFSASCDMCGNATRRTYQWGGRGRRHGMDICPACVRAMDRMDDIEVMTEGDNSQVDRWDLDWDLVLNRLKPPPGR